LHEIEHTLVEAIILVLLVTIATFVGIFLIPVCYVFVQGLAEFRKKPSQTVPIEAPPTDQHVLTK
jgi:hypothetical protein